VGFEGVLAAYNSKIGSVQLAGPTSFAPAIKKTIALVKAAKVLEFTICLIIADGQVTSVKDTEAAIIEASKLPISIICVGVGDGPWGEVSERSAWKPEGGPGCQVPACTHSSPPQPSLLPPPPLPTFFCLPCSHNR
jgi:hypothetical protein